MAIDTDHKKGSLLGLMLPPDATIEQNDWQTLLDLYSGILATAAGFIKITSTVAVEYVAMTHAVVEFVGMSNTVVEYIDQDITVGGSL